MYDFLAVFDIIKNSTIENIGFSAIVGFLNN